MKCGLVLVTLLAICGQALTERARYDNYRVYKVSIENEQQLEVLKMVESNPDGVSYIIVLFILKTYKKNSSTVSGHLPKLLDLQSNW